MKSYKKWTTIAAVLALSTSLAFAAPHEGKGGHRRGRGQQFGQRFAEKLNLTDAQKQQLQDVRKNFREQNKAFFDSSRETFKQFREARKAGDTARVEALKPAMEQQWAQMKQLRQQQTQQVLALLTPEQRTQWEAMKAERQARRGEHKHDRQ
jgi:protein CpxP